MDDELTLLPFACARATCVPLPPKQRAKIVARDINPRITLRERIHCRLFIFSPAFKKGMCNYSQTLYTRAWTNSIGAYLKTYCPVHIGISWTTLNLKATADCYDLASDRNTSSSVGSPGAISRTFTLLAVSAFCKTSLLVPRSVMVRM